MMDEEKIFYNAVARALWGDPGRIRALQRKTRKRCGDLFGPWRAAYEMLKAGTAGDDMANSRKPIPDPAAEREELERADIRIVFREDEDFPPLLREMHDPPLAIYVRGVLPVASSPTLAIVGTRRATPDGKAAAKHFGRELARAGCVIVSGLALGIDAAGHEGCLEVPDGRAVAVLAGGLDDFYPAENEWLGRKIIERGGAAISEYPLGEPPYQARFLERNRIVCGLARGVLIVECPFRLSRDGAIRPRAESRPVRRPRPDRPRQLLRVAPANPSRG